MIQMAILDIDGTLMDTNYLHVEAWARAFQTIGHPASRSRIHRQIGKGSNLMLDEFLQDHALRRQASDLHSEYYAQTQPYGYPLPGAKTLLARLAEHEIEIWLATSAKPEELDHHIQALEAKNLVKGIVSSDDVDRAKPAPDVFQETLKRSGRSVEASVVVGDTIWDIQAANACGLATMAVMTGGAFSRQELQEAGAVSVYADCEDLLASGFPGRSINR